MTEQQSRRVDVTGAAGTTGSTSRDRDEWHRRDKIPLLGDTSSATWALRLQELLREQNRLLEDQTDEGMDQDCCFARISALCARFCAYRSASRR